jgi:uncharacterized protein (TIGR02145 family)
MKNSLLILAATIFLSGKISSQVVQGKIIDEDQMGLPGITLNLYANFIIYNTTTLADGSFSFIITQVNDEQLPIGYAISNNFPNPFNPKTRIGITLPNNKDVRIEVFNLLGELVTDVIERTLDAGTNFIDVELNGLPNGMYFLKVNIDNKYNVVKKVMLIYGSQHLSSTQENSASLPNVNNYNSYSQNIILDSLVASSPIIGSKTFANLPNLTGNFLDLGNLIIERFCPETPTVYYVGKLYHTVKIGSQCWLKENLDVGTRINGIQNASNNVVIEKYCFNDSDANCDQDGGFYQWNEAMQYVTTPSAQGICPAGWHIPTFEEFQTLRLVVNDDGNALKAIGQGTNDGAGTNASGFSALLLGCNEDGNFHHRSMFAYYWSSTEYIEPTSIYMTLNYYGNGIGTYQNWKRYGYCIRCIRD